MNFDKYLQESEIINFHDANVAALASNLAKEAKDDEDIAKNCFLYVRDKIQHSGDFQSDFITISASDVLEKKAGWCYAKSHLLAALLRANKIPTGFCYQRLTCNEYEDDTYCLHGLNAIYLKQHGWYKIDARGNKEGVDAQFQPPLEKLAFEAKKDEFDLPDIYDKPLDVVIDKLKSCSKYDDIVGNFPDIKVN